MIISKPFPTIPPFIDFEEDVRTLFKRGHDDGFKAACNRCPLGADVDDALTRAKLKGYADGALHIYREMWPVLPVKGRNWDELFLESCLTGWRCGFDLGCKVCGCDPALQSEIAPYLYIPPCTFLDQD